MSHINVDIKTNTENPVGIFPYGSLDLPHPPPWEEHPRTKSSLSGHAPKMIAGAFR